MEETIRTEAGMISWQFSKHVVTMLLVIVLGMALLMEQFFPGITEWFPGRAQIMEAEYGGVVEGNIKAGDSDRKKDVLDNSEDIILKKVLLEDDPASDMLLLEKDVPDKSLVLPDVSDGNLWEANQQEVLISERDGEIVDPIMPYTPSAGEEAVEPIVPYTPSAGGEEVEPVVPDTSLASGEEVTPIVLDIPSAGWEAVTPIVPDIPSAGWETVTPIVPDTPPVGGEAVTPIMPDTPSAGGEAAEPIVPDVPSAGGEVTEPIVPDTPSAGGEAAEPIVPDVPSAGGEAAEPTVPDTPTGGQVVDPAVPDTGAEDDSGEQKQVSAFLLDDMGMLYGFLPEYAEIPDGCLTLPTECTGIRQGAFSGCGAGILELYIPAGTVTIEEGALSNLVSLEWIDVEEGNYAYTSDGGVLFDSTMSVLLAFPPGWLDLYSVPPCVIRIADRAFDGTSIYKLDIRNCADLSFGNNVFGSSGGSGIQVAVRESEMEMYAERLAEYAVTLTK